MTSTRRRDFTPTDVALVAVFAALLAVLSVAPPIAVGVVPITLQTLGVALAGLVLGPLRGFLAVLLYLVVGFAGLPIFAGGRAGLAVLGAPSAGYLLSFPIAALVAGVLSRVLPRVGRLRYLWLFLSGFGASILIVHPAGILGLIANADMTPGAAVATDVVFWPGDVIKNLVAAAIALAVHRAFPDLILRQRSGVDQAGSVRS